MSLTSTSSSSGSTSNSIANLSNTSSNKQIVPNFGSNSNQPANRYIKTGNSGAAMSATSTPFVGTIQSLGLMVATRFGNDPSSRHQTVILHPRSVNPSKALTNPCNIVTTTSANIGTANIKTATALPINTNSSHSSIPVRPALGTNAQSVHQSNTGTVKQICAPAGRSFNIASTTIPFESVGLVVTNDSNNTRRINIHPNTDVNIVNVKSGSANNVTASVSNIHHNVAKIATVTRTNQTAKMINISSANMGTPNTATVNSATGQPLTRVNIISQLPSGSSISAPATKPMINLTTAALSKPMILNPAPSVVAPNIVASGTANLINMGNINTYNAGVSQNQSKSGVLPVNQTVVTLTPTTTASSSASGNASSSSGQSRHPLITTSNVHHSQTAPKLASNTVTTFTTTHQAHTSGSSSGSSSSTTRLIHASSVNSPVKQSLQSSTPSSPRPSILSRKRIGGDSQNSSAFSSVYKSPTSSKMSNNLVINNVLKTPKSKKPDEKEENNGNDKQSFSSTSNLAHQQLSQQQSSTQSDILGTPNSDASGATPRKKPRKQLLEPFNLTTSHNIKLLSSNDENSKLRLDDKESNHSSREGISDTDGQGSTSSNSGGSGISGSNGNGLGNSSGNGGVVITIHNKPRPSILNTYQAPWKSLQYHFLRYSDVKQKPEKKLTLSELSSEGLQRKNGWKVHHLVTHIEETDEEENQIFERLNLFLQTFEKNDDTSLSNNINLLGLNCFNSSHSTIPLFDKLTDLIRGNIQRSKLFQEQIHEAKSLLIKLANDHKERVSRLTKKCVNKRTYINK